MRSFVFYVVGLLGSVVIAPAVCPAEDSDLFSFPLPLSLVVGNRWIYSIVKTHVNEDGIPNTLSTETLTIRVVERLQIEDQTYFALSDGGIYRVDEASRTWQYDTEAKSEKIVWDIWGPIEYKIIERPLSMRSWLEPGIEKAVIDGYECKYECLSRHGPFVLRPVSGPGYEEVYAWIYTIEADTVRHDFYIENYIPFPYTLTYADILKYPDWGITELYVFQNTQRTTEYVPIRTLVSAPNVGVVYYEFAEYFYSTGIAYDEIEKTAWILRDVQKGDPGNTVVEDTSWGS